MDSRSATPPQFRSASVLQEEEFGGGSGRSRELNPFSSVCGVLFGSNAAVCAELY